MNCWKLVGLVGLITHLGTAILPAPPQNQKAEVFRVSEAGKANLPEDRERLVAIYGEVAKEFNAKAKKEFAEQKEMLEGQRLRIVDVLDSAKKLYLAQYDGDVAVLQISGPPIKKGNQSPPLEITKSGTYETEITRFVSQDAKPGTKGRVKLNDDDDGAVTFFGVKLEIDGEVVKQQEVTKKETLPKYVGTISTKKMTAAPQMDRERFLSHLKNGNYYEVRRKELRKCQECRGFRRVPNDGTKPKAADGKMPCPECKEVGKREWNVKYTVVW